MIVFLFVASVWSFLFDFCVENWRFVDGEAIYSQTNECLLLQFVTLTRHRKHFAGASAVDYVDPFADPEVPDRYFLLVEQQQDSAAMDLSVDAEATGNQVLLLLWKMSIYFLFSLSY